MTIKKERGDKTRNKIKYIKEVISDPCRTDREIAAAMGTSHTTVQQMRKEVCHSLPTESERIAKLLEDDLVLQEKITRKKMQRLDDPEDKINNSDLDKWEQTATKRRQILTGGATERIEIANFSPLQLQNVAQELLKASQQ